MNVVIEHFVTIQDPLYGRLRLILNDDVPRWKTVDLEMWRGRRAYLEFADTTTQDLHDMRPPAGCGPEGYIALGRALLSDEGPPAMPESASSQGLLGDEPVDSPSVLAGRYGRAVAESLAAMGDGSLPDLPDVEARADLLAWLVERGLLDLDPSSAVRLGALLKSFREVEAGLPEPRRAPAMTEGTPEDEAIALRGNPKNVGPIVPRRMIGALAGDRETSTPAVGSGRLELARRIADPANPLTARVAVNRVWHHLFGRGIVTTVDNFGALGDRPSHPELLDDLADRFVRDGWSIKRLVRELVLSRTFRMASTSSPEAEAADPDNRLLHRMPVRRLEAEAIRDAILAVSGRLDGRMEGPGVEVYLTPFMDNYTDNYGRPKASGPLDGDGRRSLYITVRRNFPTPMLAAFDMPQPLATVGRRDVSNVPAQALILMNDPFVAQQARLWARRMLAVEGLDATGRVRRMYLDAYARPPAEAELQAALRFLDRHGDELGIPPGDPWRRRANLGGFRPRPHQCQGIHLPELIPRPVVGLVAAGIRDWICTTADDSPPPRQRAGRCSAVAAGDWEPWPWPPWSPIGRTEPTPWPRRRVPPRIPRRTSRRKPGASSSCSWRAGPRRWTPSTPSRSSIGRMACPSR